MSRRTPALARGINESLWPPPTTYASDGEPARVSYRVVPNAGDPRLLLPNSGRAAASVLRNFRLELGARSRWRTRALRATLRVTGGWPLVRDDLAVEWPAGVAADGIEAFIGEILHDTVRVGIQLGPPRANRKPIIQVVDRRHRPVAFGKLSINALTRRLLQGEAAALRTIGTRDLGNVDIPRVIHAGDWNGQYLLLTTPLPLASSSTRVPAAQRVQAMVDTAQVLGTRQGHPGESEHLRYLADVASTIDHPQIRDATQSALERLMAGDASWTFGAWHGDWTIWNMASKGSRLLLWDWERFADDVPVGWDALHFDLREQLASAEPTTGVTMRLLDRSEALLAPFAVPAERARDVARAYLVELALRYTVDGQRTVGARSARVEEWILPVLPCV